MPDVPARDPALDYFYFGFHRALRRFRATTVAGWCVAGAGVAAVALRWDPLWRGDLAGGILCGVLVVAGILLVQQGVTELSWYIHVPFPRPPAGEEETANTQSAVEELSRIMEDVEDGGWQDALQALADLRGIGERYGLPEPDGKQKNPGGQEGTGSKKPTAH